MSHNIEPYDHYTAGEYIKWEFTVRENGSIKPLVGGGIEWQLLENQGDAKSEAVLTGDDAEVTAQITDAGNGKVTVEIESEATSDLSGDYWQRIIITDSQDRTEKWGGRFSVDYP